MIDACAGRNRFTLDLHLCKQLEAQPEGSGPTGVELWQVCTDVSGTMQQSGPACFNKSVSRPLESLL